METWSWMRDEVADRTIGHADGLAGDLVTAALIAAVAFSIVRLVRVMRGDTGIFGNWL